MKINTLHPLFAAELIGADASVPDAALVDVVEDLMREHAVLCIRGQGNLDDEQHLAFARAFGPLELPAARPTDAPARLAFGLYDASNLDSSGEIIELGSLRAKFAKGNELFHADSSYNSLPSKWSILRGVIIPAEGGNTEFIDMRAVYDALSDEMKERISGLKAEHNLYHSRRKGGAEVKENSAVEQYMRAEHPLVRESASGRKTLFVGAHAAKIVGMGDQEGTGLIEELLAFAAQPQFIYSHKWSQGDIVIWDNRCTLHRGTTFNYERDKRDLRRANVNESGEEVSAIPATFTFMGERTAAA